MQRIERTPVGGGALDEARLETDLPLAKGIRINNRLLETFLPNVFEYTVTLPAGTTEVPDVRPHDHRFRSRVLDAASVNGKATLILWDRNETNSVRYTIRFVTPTP